MAKFITGEELENAIVSVIRGAKEILVIVSPFIKLDDYFIDIFKPHITNSQLHLLLVFGKNEQDVSKSLNTSDFEFFKNFPYVSIIYVPNLHAKYYGNESKGVITSINLYDYSFKNNIEFGVFYENGVFDMLKRSSDNEAWDKCQKIAEEGIPVYIKRPMFKKKMLISKDYINSKVLLDNTASFYSPAYNRNHDNRTLSEFPDEIDFEKQPVIEYTRQEYEDQKLNAYKAQSSYTSSVNEPTFNSTHEGYCIRTGVQIQYNPSRPFSTDAYRSWAKFENWDYPEQFCHKTGKRSNGKTSMRNPTLNYGN